MTKITGIFIEFYSVWFIPMDRPGSPDLIPKKTSLASCQPSTYLQNLISLIVQLWWAIVPAFLSILKNYRLVCFWSLPPKINFWFFVTILSPKSWLDWEFSPPTNSKIECRRSFECSKMPRNDRIIWKKVSVQPLQSYDSYGMTHMVWCILSDTKH